MEEIRLKKVDDQGNEHREHDEVRGVGKASEDWATLGGAAAYPATLLEFYLPSTGGATPFAATAVKRVVANQYAKLRGIILHNAEADARTFIFYDGDPGGAAGTFKMLFTFLVAATTYANIGKDILDGFLCTYGLYVDPSGTKTAGLSVSVSADIINKEVTE